MFLRVKDGIAAGHEACAGKTTQAKDLIQRNNKAAVITVHHDATDICIPLRWEDTAMRAI